MTKIASAKSVQRQPSRKAVVVGEVTTRSGKTYHILQPLLPATHLTVAQMDAAVDEVLARRVGGRN